MSTLAYKFNKHRRLTEIGPALKYFRRLYGLSQQDMAKATGSSSGHISRVEAGKSQASIDLLDSMLEVLNLEIRLHPKEESFTDDA